MRIRIMASRHSAFYSPLLGCIQILRGEGHEVTYSVLGAGPAQLRPDPRRRGRHHAIGGIVQLESRERGVEPLPVHFAQINQRDGFFLAGTPAGRGVRMEEARRPNPAGGPRSPAPGDVAVRRAAQRRRLEEDQGSRRRNARSDGRGLSAAAAGTTSRASPIVAGEMVASVGASMPAVAFSSLCCARNSEDRGIPEFPQRVRPRPESGCGLRRPRRSPRPRPICSR